jgi:hypothetical protein
LKTITVLAVLWNTTLRSWKQLGGMQNDTEYHLEQGTTKMIL